MATTATPALSALLARRPPAKRWPASAADVDVRETGKIAPRLWHYTVMVDGMLLDQFTSSGRFLTWSDLADVAAGYSEAINCS